MKQNQPAIPVGPQEDGLRVLLLAPNAARDVAEGLRSSGHQVYVASDSNAALQVARLQPPDVVVLACDKHGEEAHGVIDQLNDPKVGKRPFVIHLSEDRHDPRAASKIDLHLSRRVPLNLLHRLLKRFQSIVQPMCGVSTEVSIE